MVLRRAASFNGSTSTSASSDAGGSSLCTQEGCSTSCSEDEGRCSNRAGAPAAGRRALGLFGTSSFSPGGMSTSLPTCLTRSSGPGRQRRQLPCPGARPAPSAAPAGARDPQQRLPGTGGGADGGGRRSPELSAAALLALRAKALAAAGQLPDDDDDPFEARPPPTRRGAAFSDSDAGQQLPHPYGQQRQAAAGAPPRGEQQAGAAPEGQRRVPRRHSSHL
jgi:hypothetical protein